MTDESDATAPDETPPDETPPDNIPSEEPVAEDMSAFEHDLNPDSVLEQTLVQLETSESELARARADLYNVNQEYGNYVRRSKTDASAARQTGQLEVVESLLSVLDDIDAAREAGDLDGPFAAIAAKLEDTLGTRFGLERYGAVGDVFDPQIHEALMAQSNPDVEVPVIKQVLQPGYRAGDRVLRPTKVMVDNPE